MCVGIAPTKTLSKLANHCAKKGLVGADGVCDFTAITRDELTALFDRIAADMDRQMDAMFRQARMLETAAVGDAPFDQAGFGALPAGTVSYRFVSTSTGNGVCSRSVQVTSLGAGQQPKVVSSSSGDCGAPAHATAPAVAAPARTAAPANTI